jgi:hypothetical protein
MLRRFQLFRVHHGSTQLPKFKLKRIGKGKERKRRIIRL